MLKVEHLSKVFASDAGTRVRAIDDVSFVVPPGVVFSLLGPSGCGKTTTLRSIAGLEPPSSGVIYLADREVYNSHKGVSVPTNHRDIGMVFQSYAIWPHMNVFDNVALPLRVGRQKLGRAERDERVRSILSRMRLAGFERRQATRLSGGQQQRLALARALVREPSLLLLDEPLSNLDAKLREQMRGELKRLQRELGITTMYVTHDHLEALALSDIIAVMKDGQILQIGTPQEIYERPTSVFVAGFVGTSNFIRGTVRAILPGNVCRVECPAGELFATSARRLDNGQETVIAVRPENVHLLTDEPESRQDLNTWEVRVDSRTYVGGSRDYSVVRGEAILRTRTYPRLDYQSLDLEPGQTAYVQMRVDRCVSLPLDGIGYAEDMAGDGLRTDLAVPLRQEALA